MHIIDRRLNPKGKSLPNRQRFLRRAKALVRDAVHQSSASRGVRDVEQGGELSIPKAGVSEPTFHHGQGTGVRDHVLPGNKEFVEGDRLPRPPGGAGRGTEGSRTEAERMISALPYRVTNSWICSLRIWSFPTW